MVLLLGENNLKSLHFCDGIGEKCNGAHARAAGLLSENSQSQYASKSLTLTSMIIYRRKRKVVGNSLCVMEVVMKFNNYLERLMISFEIFLFYDQFREDF